MYSDNNRRVSVRRANDEFLRRMIGGELTGAELPVMNMERPQLPVYPQQGKVACDGSTRNSGEDSNGCSDRGDCPVHVHAPSLAMVYSPKQCWRNLLDPQSALENGSLFAELLLPFECGWKKTGGEVNPRK